MAVRENDFDPTTWTEEELEKVARSLGYTGGRSMPQEWQRNKVTAELRRRADAARDQRAANKKPAKDSVEQNNDAAATPIVLESVAGMPTGWGPRGRDMRQEQIDRLIAAGDDPVTAARVVDHEMATNSGRIQPGLFDSYNTPQGNEALRGRIADGRRANARQDAFEANYNAATGHPEYGYDEAGNPARVGLVDIDNPSEMELRARGERAYNARDPRGAEAMAAGGEIGSDYAPYTPEPQYADMTVPGPRTLDGKSPTQSRGLTAEEAEAYNTRKPGQLSQRDADMRRRGYVPVVTADGVKYMLAAGDETDTGPIPGGYGRRGQRPDLTGGERPKYKQSAPGEYVGPDGKAVSVLVPDEKFAAGQKATLAARRKRLSGERDEARKRWQATAYLAGGSQNLNSGNRWIANSLANMNPEEQKQAMRYMLPGGQLQAQVDAQNMQNANEVIKRFMTSGAAAGMNNPVAAAAMQQQQVQQQQGIVDWAEQNINDNYAWDSDTFLPGSDFTTGERQQAIDDLMSRYGPPGGTLTLGDATRIVDNIAKRKPQPASAGPMPVGPGGLPIPPGGTPYRTGS